MIITLSVRENSAIGSDEQWTEPPAGGLRVPDAVFQLLRQFAFDNDQADGLLTFSVQKGRELVKLRNYVGLLPLTNRTQLEILPKAGQVEEARPLLLNMLRYLRQSPCRMLPAAYTQASQLPLWETFITAFLDSVEPLVQQGIQRAYVTVEDNERFWKGKFQYVRQQRENAWHAERLAVRYDSLTADVAANRILKTTLTYLSGATANPRLLQRIGQLAWAMDDVCPSDSIPDDWRIVRRSSPLFRRYEQALRWAEALLHGRGFGIRTGSSLSMALLFPMERVFEDYVAYGIKAYWPDTDEVRVQESSAHLVDEHVGTPKFRLRPDIVIRHNDRTLVFDTKWKTIRGPESGTGADPGTYGIEQADLYQLYAYGKKYAASDLFLIYPANEAFRRPLAVFDYDATTRLHVVPFDVTNSLAHEVERLTRYALTFQTLP